MSAPVLHPSQNQGVAEGEDAAAWRFLDAIWDVPVGLGLCDLQLHFLRVNQALASFDGLTIEEHYRPHDSLERLPRGLAAGLQAMEQDASQPLEAHFTTAGSRVVRVRLHAVLRPSDREVVGIGLVAFDVTAEREAFDGLRDANAQVGALLAEATLKELALERLLEAVPEGVLLLDAQGRIRLVNRAAELLFGRTRLALLGSRFDEQHWTPGARAGATAIANLLAQPASAGVYRGDLVLQGAARQIVLAEATALRSHDARGSEEIVVSLREVTGDRQHADTTRAKAAFQELLLGIVAHDLRNPLAAVVASVDLLRMQRDLSSESVRAIERISRSSGRMTRLIGDLLDYTRIGDAGRLPITLAQADLHQICRRSVEECRAAHPGQRIELVEKGDGLGLWDAERLEQAVTNLIANAVQHGQGAGIVVRSTGLEAGRTELEVSVQNQGVAIPPEVLPELFKPFRRSARSGARGSGLGLGLFIVGQIAGAHGGTVSARSSAAEGTIVVIKLPRLALPGLPLAAQV